MGDALAVSPPAALCRLLPRPRELESPKARSNKSGGFLDERTAALGTEGTQRPPPTGPSPPTGHVRERSPGNTADYRGLRLLLPPLAEILSATSEAVPQLRQDTQGPCGTTVGRHLAVRLGRT